MSISNYNISELMGWDISVSDYSKSITFYFNKNQKITLPLFGNKIIELVNQIYKDNLDKIKENSLIEIQNHGVTHKTIFSKYYITNEFIEINRFKKMYKIPFQFCKDVKYTEISGNHILQFIYNDKQYKLSSYAFRKNIGIFYAIIDIFAKYA